MFIGSKLKAIRERKKELVEQGDLYRKTLEVQAATLKSQYGWVSESLRLLGGVAPALSRLLAVRR